MRLKRAMVAREMQRGEGGTGDIYQGDACKLLPRLIERYGGQVQLIYIDPPFATGQQFEVRVRVGEKEHKSGVGTLTLPAYRDALDEMEYLGMMRTMLEGARALLGERGTIFLHIDHRMHAKLRLLMDEIFGPEQFLNEIVWAYQTGGRARKHFSRKHDIILFYSKTKRYFFDLAPVAISREGVRRNHMKRHVDPDGRVYRSIRSGEKVYTYYDDEPTYPSDVWDDVSHLQQKDPQRTGYDTQKPLPLLERIVLCASKEGDLVCDLFAGSGTTLDAARRHGRRFLGVDESPMAMHVIRRRMMGANVTYHMLPASGEPTVEICAQMGVGFYELEITQYAMEPGACPRDFAGLDALDGWTVGYLRGGAFVAMAHAQRSKATPKIKTHLQLPILEGVPMIRTTDVLGRGFYYEIVEGG